MPRRSTVAPSLAEQLAAALVEARGERPRAQLADAAGMHPGTLRELEANHRGDGAPNNPTLKRVEQIGEVYGVRFRLVAEPIA